MTNDERYWLEVLANLNISKSSGNAPYKPLLLLIVLELIEKGALTSDRLDLTPELVYRFLTFWEVVAHRRTQRPDVRMPFHHLKGDKIWEPFTEDDRPSPHRSITRYVKFDPRFLEFAVNPNLRMKGRRILISNPEYFEPDEQVALYALSGMRVPKTQDVAKELSQLTPKQARKKGREARFRLDIVAAYHYTCALTGYRVTTINGSAIVDAAHIHQFSDSRNDNPRNGLALCKNAHWLFDNGLWSLDDNYRVIVAAEHFSEDNPDQKSLSEYVGLRVRLPEQESLWPDQKHLRWHRNKWFAKE